MRDFVRGRPGVGVALVLWLALGGCAHTFDPDGALAALPYTLQGNGRIVVEATIAGQGPFAFALDTAASRSMINDELRVALGLETLPGLSASVRGLVASGLYPVVSIPEIVLGPERWTDARVVSIPPLTAATRTLDGVLGIDFLRRYAVGFSPEDRVVRLYPPAVVSRRVYPGWATVPLEPRRIGATSEALYFFDIRLGDQSVPALFDLGAGLNMLNTAGAIYFQLTDRSMSRRPLVAGAFDETGMLGRLTDEPVTTGSVTWRDEVFLIGDLEIFETLSYADRPLAIIGAGMFNQREFVIDFERRRLLVHASVPEVEPVEP
jgi:hypothetical protein